MWSLTYTARVSTKKEKSFKRKKKRKKNHIVQPELTKITFYIL